MNRRRFFAGALAAMGMLLPKRQGGRIAEVDCDDTIPTDTKVIYCRRGTSNADPLLISDPQEVLPIKGSRWIVQCS